MESPSLTKLERTVGLVVLGLLLLGSLAVLWPFLSAFLWALVLCVTCWPLHLRVVRWLGGRRTAAAAVTTLTIALVLLLPFVAMALTLADDATRVAATVGGWLQHGPPPPPAWLENVRGVGPKAAELWRDAIHDHAQFTSTVKPLLGPALQLLGSAGWVLLQGLIQLALSVLIAFFIFRDGAAAFDQLTRAANRIGGPRAQRLLAVAGTTIRSVVYGVLGTALAQAIFAWIGFVIAGVPGSALLALLTFLVSIAPVGSPLIWAPTAMWLFAQGRPGWGVFMIAWGLMVSSTDYVIKPLLISQGSRLPFVIIFFGVLGGAIVFGFIGVFIGPTLLALTLRLIEEWIALRPGSKGDTGDKGADADSASL